VVKQTHAEGKYVTRSYGLSSVGGEIETVTAADETNRKVRIHYDAFGAPVERIKMRTNVGDPEAVTKLTRDPLGRISGLADPNGNVWGYTYDKLSRRTAVAD